MSRNLSFRHHPFLACALIAVVGGMMGGATTVHGLQLNRYGDPSTPAIRITPTAETSDIGCVDCSERALGFRWAAIRGISSSIDCPDESWDFRRGCAAYANGDGV